MCKYIKTVLYLRTQIDLADVGIQNYVFKLFTNEFVEMTITPP